MAKSLNPFEHARKRPDMYGMNGETEPQEKNIFDVEQQRFVTKVVNYNNGLFNIAREVGSNTIDNKWKSEESEVFPDTTKIKILVDLETGSITFQNDGRWIPIEKEEFVFKNLRTGKTTKEMLYPSEIFFGDMFSGTNYDDSQKRKTSGRNGIGAKLCNIFSTFFRVEHTDPSAGKKFVQIYTNGGMERTKPKVTSIKSKVGYTKITFTPDYEYFKYPYGDVLPKGKTYGIDEDYVEVLRAYAYEMAMITGLPIQFNKTTIRIPSLGKYAKLFYSKCKSFSFTSPEGDECILLEKEEEPEENQIDNVQHVSFINGIRTSRGGNHLNTWRDAIFGALVKSFNARKTKVKFPVKTSAKEVYPYFILFVRGEIDNPQFDGNDKEFFIKPKYNLYNTRSKNKKEEWERTLTAAVKTIMKWNFVKLLEDKLIHKLEKSSTKNIASKISISDMDGNLTDADKAGGKEWKKCTLYITEGKSAKTLADRGIGELHSREYDGTFAIRGKFTNVHELSNVKIRASEIASNLIEVLGLDNKDHPRYGSVRIMTDADDDGYHIKGLLIAFFYKMKPDMIREGKVESFNTAVSRVTLKGSGKTILFYSNPEFKKWYKESPDRTKVSFVEYYKGLGSINPKDAPIYFRDQKVVQFVIEDEERARKFMDLGFHSSKVFSDMRKDWICKKMPKAIHLDESKSITFEEEDEPDFVYEGKMDIGDYIDHQLIIYCKAALERALPCIWDGLKEGQRKVLYGMIKKNYTRTVSIDVAAAAVKEITHYHHGDKAIQDTMIKLAQGFPGSNNIPLLVNDGEFGTRQEGGKDHASAKYIKTKLEDIVKALFPSDDFNLLKQKMDDNEKIEYEFFIPIIPLILTNETIGIASGFSTNIPSYNPEDIIKRIEVWLDDEKKFKNLPPMKPWYRGFTGEITLDKGEKDKYYTRWISKGIINEVKGGWFEISEIPIRLWTLEFRQWLKYLETGVSPKGKKWPQRNIKALSKIVDNSKVNTVDFRIKPTRDFRPDVKVKGNFNNLISCESLKNMVVVDELGYPYRFNTAEEILELFCYKRLDFYELRKEYLLKLINFELERSINKYRFVKLVKDRKLDLYRNDDDLTKELKKLKFAKLSFDEKPESYDYLLNMQMRSMTVRNLEKLKREKIKLNERLEELQKKSPKDLWREDLENVKVAYKKFLKTRVE